MGRAQLQVSAPEQALLPGNRTITPPFPNGNKEAPRSDEHLNPDPTASKCHAPEIPLWPRGLRPQGHALPRLGPAPLGPFEGGYKWLPSACGPVWVGMSVALVTNGMAGLSCAMFREVLAPNRLVSAVTQEVITSVSKAPPLTFLRADMGATESPGEVGRGCGWQAQGVCHPLAKQTGAPGRERMLRNGLLSLSLSIYTQRELVTSHVLTQHTHVQHTHTCTITHSYILDSP